MVSAQINYTNDLLAYNQFRLLQIKGLPLNNWLYFSIRGFSNSFQSMVNGKNSVKLRCNPILTEARGFQVCKQVFKISHARQLSGELTITEVLEIHPAFINSMIPVDLSRQYPQSSALIIIFGKKLCDPQFYCIIFSIEFQFVIIVKNICKNKVSYKKMKKKRLDGHNKIYGFAPLPNPNANEIKLKQIYESAFRSREKSPKVSFFKNDPSPRYQMLQSDNKHQVEKPSRYKAYLESEMIPKVRHNRRYKKIDKQEDQKPLIPVAITSRAERNQSVDMFKIRKPKVNSSHKVSSSYTRLDETINEFENAKSLYKQGKFEQALQIANEILSKDPRNPEYLYYTSIIHLNLHNYSKGLQLLEKVCKEYKQYKKTSFLFASIAAKKLGFSEKAIKFSSEGIDKYPNYQELILYRGHIYFGIRNYELAQKDYEQYLKFDPNNVEIMMKNSQCLREIGATASCLSSLANALYADKGQYKEQILRRRIEINLQSKSYNLKQAKKDLNKLTSISPNNAQIPYLRGIILAAQGLRKQSLLSFEQGLKEGGSTKIMCKCLVEIVKNKIMDRDFYSASYHINRSKYLQLSSDEISIYKLFSEGVVHLMKRKIAEGDQNFTTLIQKFPQFPPFLSKMFYLYRAFAKFSLSEYQEAIQSYQQANRQQSLDMFAKFNKQLAQGIIEVNKKNYQKGFELFNIAQKTVVNSNLNKIDPYLYRAATHIQKAKDLLQSDIDLQELKSLEEIFSGLKQLDKAYDINDSNSNQLYFRSLVYLYLGKYQEALQDIIKAISKSEENVAKYFFFRGVTQSSLGNKKQALNDFNICSNLDEKFTPVYLEKAKIHFSNENVTKGLEDLIKLKSIDPTQDVKYHEACLNYVFGHNTMANACIQQVQDQTKARAIKILIKTKIGKLKQGKKLLKGKTDLMIYDILLGKTDRQDQNSSDLEFFNLYHYHHYLGVKYFRLEDFEKSLDYFVMANKERSLYDLEQGISNNTTPDEQQEQDAQFSDSEKNIIHRINFNIFLCYLQSRQWKKAYQVFIRDIVGVKQSLLKNEYIASLSHLFFQAIKQGNNISTAKSEKQVYEFKLYDSKLDRVLPEVCIQLPNFILKSRLCLLGLTNPKLEQIYQIKANPEFVLGYLKLTEIQNRPEPPWVKREQSGLIFTDEVQNINIQFQTTQNDEQQNESQQGSDQDQEGEQQSAEKQGSEEDQDPGQAKENDEKLSLQKFKEKMKLGDSIQRKLKKIMEMKKKQSQLL